VVRGKLPIGGLSSSAAVTTAYLLALCDVNDIEVQSKDLIRFSHWVEREFIGLNNGILDQSANILSRAHHLMFMGLPRRDLRTLSPGAFDARVRSGHCLFGHQYGPHPDRLQQSSRRVQGRGLDFAGTQRKCISSLRDVKLRDIPVAVFVKHRSQLAGRFMRRADHFFSELERVRAGVDAWKAGDLAAFGRLMFRIREELDR